MPFGTLSYIHICTGEWQVGCNVSWVQLAPLSPRPLYIEYIYI